MRGFNYKKAVQSLNLLALKEGEKINKMKAIKLIWLTDRFHLRHHGRTITGDVYFALKHGPVPSTTRDILEKNGVSLEQDELHYSLEYLSVLDNYNYTSAGQADKMVFSKTDLDAIDTIYNLYGKYDHYALRDISHNFPEWKKFEFALNKGIASRFQMDLVDFFDEAPAGTDKVIINAEIIEFSKYIYTENKEIENYLK